MPIDPKVKQQKKYLTKAERAKKALLDEKKRYGSFDDSSGRRYLIGVYYLMGGELQKAVNHYRWFKKNFSDDIGEPIYWLFGALTFYRADKLKDASLYLLDTMISNLYLLPHVFGEDLATTHAWTFSGHDYPEYITDPYFEPFLDEPTEQEREWIKQWYQSDFATQLRQSYIEMNKALKDEREVPRRRLILDKWYQARDKARLELNPKRKMTQKPEYKPVQIRSAIDSLGERYAAEFIMNAVDLCERDGVPAIAQLLGIDENTLYRWCYHIANAQ